MPSSFSASLRLELTATGEQTGAWGVTNNTNLGTLVEQAITGVGAIVMADAAYTLTAANGLTDEARNAVLSVTSSTALTAPRDLIIPAVKKTYTVRNATSGGQSITVRVAGQAGAVLLNGCTAAVYCDGATTVIATAPYNAATGTLALNQIAVTTASVTGTLTAGVVTTPGALSVGGAAAITGALTVAGALTSSGGMTAASINVSGQVGTTTLAVSNTANFGFVPSNLVPITITAGNLGYGLDIKGRASDQVGILRFLNNAGTTELARLQSASNGSLSLYLGTAGTTTAFTADSTGALYFPKTVTSNFGRFVSAGTSNPSFCAFDTAQGYAAGMFIGGAKTLVFGNMAGTGDYVGPTLGYFTQAGNFIATGSVAGSSDARLKTNITALEAHDADAIVANLAHAAARFEWIDPDRPGQQLGVIAQDVEPYAPEAVTAGPDGILAVSDRPMVAALLVSVASLLKRVDTLEARLRQAGA